jgi:hypothetical protein
MELKESDCDDVEWIQLTQDRAQWLVLWTGN